MIEEKEKVIPLERIHRKERKKNPEYHLAQKMDSSQSRRMFFFFCSLRFLMKKRSKEGKRRKEKPTRNRHSLQRKPSQHTETIRTINWSLFLLSSLYEPIIAGSARPTVGIFRSLRFYLKKSFVLLGRKNLLATHVL